jgi:hypothetical protein
MTRRVKKQKMGKVSSSFFKNKHSKSKEPRSRCCHLQDNSYDADAQTILKLLQSLNMQTLKDNEGQKTNNVSQPLKDNESQKTNNISQPLKDNESQKTNNISQPLKDNESQKTNVSQKLYQYKTDYQFY